MQGNGCSNPIRGHLTTGNNFALWDVPSAGLWEMLRQRPRVIQSLLSKLRLDFQSFNLTNEIWKKKNFYIWKFLPRKKSSAFAETCCTTLSSHLVDHPFCRSPIKNVVVVVLGLGSLAFFQWQNQASRHGATVSLVVAIGISIEAVDAIHSWRGCFHWTNTVHFGEISELKQFKTACIGCVMCLVLPFNSNRKPQAVLTWLNRSQRIKSNWSSLSVLRLFQLCTRVKAICVSQLLLEDALHKKGVQVLLRAALTCTDGPGALPHLAASELARWLIIVLISHTCPWEASQLLLHLQQFISEWLLIESLESDGESLWDLNARRRDSGCEFLWWGWVFAHTALISNRPRRSVVCPISGDISESVCFDVRHFI